LKGIRTPALVTVPPLCVVRLQSLLRSANWLAQAATAQWVTLKASTQWVVAVVVQVVQAQWVAQAALTSLAMWQVNPRLLLHPL
jgi:hypothetical protein